MARKGINTGRAHTRGNAMKAARVGMMLRQRLEGGTMQEIAKEFRCHTETVRRSFRWAEEQGLIGDARHRILTELLPQAHNVYQETMAAKLDAEAVPGQRLRLEAARDVEFGTGVLSKTHDLLERSSADLTLQGYLAERTTKPHDEQDEPLSLPPADSA